MKELDLKPKFQSLQAWLWASATVRILRLSHERCLIDYKPYSIKLFFCLKISSRTLHIPWDSAGCLCPVGDLFNYDAPGDDSNTSEGPERLTDGGFDEDANAYCLYARRNYQLGEQVQVLS